MPRTDGRPRGCDRNVAKPCLLRSLGLAFERKADAPGYWEKTKVKGSHGGLGLSRRLAKQVLSQPSYTPTVGTTPILRHFPPFENSQKHSCRACCSLRRNSAMQRIPGIRPARKLKDSFEIHLGENKGALASPANPLPPKRFFFRFRSMRCRQLPRNLSSG
jgi:hypothetical protein